MGKRREKSIVNNNSWENLVMKNRWIIAGKIVLCIIALAITYAAISKIEYGQVYDLGTSVREMHLDAKAAAALAKDFNYEEENTFIATSDDPWFDINVDFNIKSVVIDLDAVDGEYCSRIYYYNDDAELNEEWAYSCYLEAGINVLQIPNGNYNKLRLDLTDIPDSVYRINKMSFYGIRMFPSRFITSVIVMAVIISYLLLKELRSLNKKCDKSSCSDFVPQNRLYSLDYIRVLAMFMILFDHLGLSRNTDWNLGQIINSVFCKPLHIIQYFGALGVSLFFILSGFFFNHSLKKCSRKMRFLLMKLSYIYLPCLASFLLFAVFEKIMSYFLPQISWWSQFTGRQWIESGTLVAYFLGDADVINGTTWFLIPLLMFTFIGTFVYSNDCNAGTKIWLSDIIMAVLMLIGMILQNYSAGYALGQYSYFMGMIISGCIIYYAYNNEITRKKAGFLILVNYVIMLVGIQLYTPSYYEESPYLVSYIYAVLIFLVGLLIGEETVECRIVNFLVSISYAVYLVHMPFGSYIISIFEDKIPYTFALLISLAAVLLFAVILHKFIEKPIKNLWRR